MCDFGPEGARSGVLFEEFSSGIRLHEIGPDLLGRKKIPLWEGVLGEPGSGIASRYSAEDHGTQILGDRAGDADRRVGFMTIVGTDDDAEPESGEIGRVLMAIAQGAFDEVPDYVVEARRKAGDRFESIAITSSPSGSRSVLYVSVVRGLSFSALYRCLALFAWA